jgi:HK97 family phage prohead protease
VQPRRPLSPSDLIVGHPDAMVVIRKTRAATDAPIGMEFVLSDASVDRMGDLIEQDGWELANFKRNPIALFNHNKDAIVGRWHDLRVEKGELRGHLELAPKGISARIDELRGLVEAGILKAVSVGFKPSQARPRGKDLQGVVFEKMELLETSLVSVPANPNALAIAKSCNVSTATLDLIFAKPGTATKQARPSVRQSERRPSAAVEARVVRLETERKQLTRRLLHQVELLVDARQVVAALVTIPGGAAELPAALKSMRAHETMAEAVSKLLGITESELFSSEQEAERLKRVRDSVARSMKGRCT